MGRVRLLCGICKNYDLKIEEFRSKPETIDNFLVYDDGIVKGTINRHNFEDATEICEFYVEPFFKRSGIGHELMEARSFYKKNGFEATGEEQLIEGTDKLDICYERCLE